MSTITAVVPPFTKVPNINDSVNFEDDTNTFLGEINARYEAGNEQASQMNTVASEVNANATTTQTNKNSVDTNKALTETYRNETLGYRNEVLSYTIPTEATYNTATIDSKINAIAPFSGYMNWKEDNFYFNVSSSFLASIADTNRYVKFGDKVVDTFLHANYNATYGGVVKSATDYIPEVTVQDQATYGLTTQSSVNVGDYVVMDRKELVTNGTFDTDISGWTVYSSATLDTSSGTIRFHSTTNNTVGAVYQTISGLVVGKKYILHIDYSGTSSYKYIRVDAGSNSPTGTGAMYGSLINDSVINGTNTIVFTPTETSVHIKIQSYLSTDYVEFDNISVKQLDEVYRAKQDAPSGTLLTNTTYFEVRDNLPISNQIAFLHTMDATTKAYEGISNEILFNDALAIETPKAIMLKNGFSEVSKGLYSKGSKLYVFAGYWQTLNKGAYHPVFNSAGVCMTRKSNGGTYYWYSTDLDYDGTIAQMFTATNSDGILTFLLTSTGKISQGYSGRPDSKFYDIIYQDQFISFESSELAYKPNSEEKKRIREYEKYRGVEGLVFTEQKLQTTTGSVATLEVNDGTKYVVNQYIQVFGDSTPYRKRIVSITGNTLTLDSVFSTSKTASNYIIGGGNIPFNSKKGTSLITDLIGSPTNYPAIMKDRLTEGKGVFGINPLLVGQDGTSYISGTITPIASRKASVNFTHIYSTDSGVTWAVSTATFNGITNALSLSINFSSRLQFAYYTSQNNPYQATTPKAVSSVEPKVIASNSHSVYKGAIVGNCIGKVQVGNGANGYESKVLENILDFSYQGVVPSSGTFTATAGLKYLFNENSKASNGVIGTIYERLTTTTADVTAFDMLVNWRVAYMPSHSAITLDNANSPASKWFEGVCYDSDYEYPFVVIEELAYNTGTTSYDGDDDKFTQLTNGTLTDLNGNTCVTKFMVGTPIGRRN